MNKKNIINELRALKFEDFSSLESKIKSLDSCQDILYQTNIAIFQSSFINHKERLLLLKKTNQIADKYKLLFCKAHNLTISIKLSKELGLQKNLIKDSHKAIDLWKNVLKQPLAINGLIFAYIDLGLTFSESSLNSLAVKYLNKAESLLSECADKYYPFIKLYVAYAVIYDRMNNYKKSNICYNKVIKIAESKKDSLTLIPVLINSTDDLIKNKKYESALKKCQKALKISDKNKEKIYKPYIYNSLASIYFDIKKYKQSKDYFKKALEAFKSMNVSKMIPQVFYSLGLIFYNQKKYDDAMDLFNTSLKENLKVNNYDLEVKVLKKISNIYKYNKNQNQYLKIADKLNNVLEKKIKSKEKIFTDTNASVFKILSEEFDLSLSKHKDLNIKINIESKKRELTTEALTSVSEREFLKKVIRVLSSQQLNNREMVQLCKQRIEETKDWNVFMKLFNDIHPSFNKYIIDKCPSITESELRICNLIKMSFSSVEISEILSISKRGVEQHRYRIRKKLNLITDLTIFIHSL